MDIYTEVTPGGQMTYMDLYIEVTPGGEMTICIHIQIHIYIEVTPGRQSRIVIQGEDVTQSPEAVLIRQALK
jgi:hypothetical protein